MKHLFVPYELAKLAKEKGFDEQCLTYWVCSHGIPFLSEVNISLTGVIQYREESMIIAPLYQQLADWFREKDIRICEKFFVGEWCWFVYKGTEEEAMNQNLDIALTEAFKLI